MALVSVIIIARVGYSPDHAQGEYAMSCTSGRNAAERNHIITLKYVLASALFLSLLIPIRMAAQSVSLTPTSLTFSSQVLNTTSASKTVTLKNSGKATLNITSMTTSGGFAATTCPSTIAVGGSCQFTVTFTPDELGTISGAVTLVDNAATGTQVLGLTGSGIAPVTFSAASLTFPATPIGTTSAAKTVTLTNHFNTSLTMGAVSTSGDYNVSSNGCTGSVAAGGTCTISVTFSPSTKGMIPGALTIGDSASLQPQVVGLSGSGTGTVTNTVSFTPTKLAFTNQAVGTTSLGQTVTLKNTGTRALTVGTIMASGNYLENDTCAGQTINPKATCTITVHFQPSGYGSVAGAITVADSAATTPQVVGLTGTGIGSFSFSPSALSFFLQTLNLPSAPLTATLTNNSGADIPISSVAISGDYAQTNNCGATLLANSSCTFNVTYMPGAAGSTDGAITVTAGSGSFQVLSLSGSGINPTRYAYSLLGNSVEAYAADPSTGFLRFTVQQTLPDTSCGTNYTASVAPSNSFFYVPSFDCTNGGTGVHAYSIAANGQLTPITGSPFNITSSSTTLYQITITPNGKFGYVTGLSPYQIIPVSINTKTGAVTQLSGTIAHPGNQTPVVAIDAAGKFLFLTDYQLGGIYVYTINATTGALTLVTGSPFGVQSGILAVHPSGKFLISMYPFNGSGGGPSVLKINTQTGALSVVPGSFSAPYANSVATDPSGNFVYVGQGSNFGTLTVFRLNATTGALTQVPGSPFATGGLYNASLSADPSGHYLYLTTALPFTGGFELLQSLSVNEQSGAVSPVTTIGFAPFNGSSIDGFTTGPKPVTFSDTYAYVANSPVTGISTQNGVLQYSINSSTGTLTQVGSLYAVSNGPQVLALHPTQQELYSSEAGGVLLGYSIGTGGALNTNALGQGEPCVHPIYSITSDPAGAWLFGTCPDNGAALWQINPDHTLGSLPFGGFTFSGPGVAITSSLSEYGPVAISSDGNWWGLYDPSNTGAMWGAGTTGNSPSAIAYDGAGRFIYVANGADNTISGYTSIGNNLIGLNSGVPYATGTTPSAIAGDPWGRYLYVANAGSQNIWEYSIDPILGNLTSLSASPLALGVSPNSLTMDYAGKFLYATNSTAGTVSVLSLNADGSLTLQGTTTVDSGATQSPAPTSIAVTGTNQ
jgi:6-phosphogluconolactonase (cycloisomerase 2 family)